VSNFALFCRHFQDSPEMLLPICQITRPYRPYLDISP